jgi:hypothetical protein
MSRILSAWLTEADNGTHKERHRQTSLNKDHLEFTAKLMGRTHSTTFENVSKFIYFVKESDKPKLHSEFMNASHNSFQNIFYAHVLYKSLMI